MITGPTDGTAGTVNTGGGGGAAYTGQTSPANGGSGICVIAYEDTYDAPSSITGTYTEPTRSGYRVYKFTGSGTIEWSSSGSFSNTYSAAFDDTTDKMDDSRNTTPWAVGTGAFSVSFWAKIATSTTGGAAMFVFRSSTAYLDGFTFYMGSSGDYTTTNGFWCSVDSTNTGWYGGGEWSTGTWHHIVFTRSGSTLTTYVDGSSIGTETVGGGSVDGGTGYGINIGQDPSTSGAYLDGNIDEVAFFTQALTASQVTNLYKGEENGGSGGTDGTPGDLADWGAGITAWYRMGDDTSITTDSQGSYNLANSGATTDEDVP